MAGIVDVKKISQDVSALDTTVKAVQSDLTTHTSNDDIHLSAQQKSDISMIADLAVALGSKVESSAFETKTKEIEALIAERVPTKTFDDTIAGLDNKYAPLAHVSNTSLHLTGDEKVNLNAILANYDGDTSIADLLTALEGKVDNEVLSTLATKVELATHTDNEEIHLTSEEKELLAQIISVDSTITQSATGVAKTAAVFSYAPSKEDLNTHIETEEGYIINLIEILGELVDKLKEL